MVFVGLQPRWHVSRCNLKWALMCRDQGETKERGSRLPIDSGKFSKQKNLHKKLVLGGQSMSKSLHLPITILKVYIEALPGFSHMHRRPYLCSVMYPVQLESKPCFYIKTVSLEELLGKGKASGTHIPRTGERGGELLIACPTQLVVTS